MVRIAGPPLLKQPGVRCASLRPWLPVYHVAVADLWDPANCSGLEEVEVPVTVPLDLLRPDKSMEAFPVLVEHCGARQVLVGLVLHDILGACL